jgi:two-component system LytT family sensor kinase
VHILVAWALYTLVLTDVCLLNNSIAVKDASISITILSLCVWGIYLVMRSYPTTVAIFFYAIITTSFFCFAGSIINWQILKNWLGHTDKAYCLWLNTTLPLRIIINFMLFGWIATYTGLKKKTDTLEDKFQQQADASTLLREAELYKLRQQLQPHFLYNSLNSINALILIEPDMAQEMVGKLSDFLRNSVKREAQDKLPITEELEYIQLYLDIEAIRFGDRLRIAYLKDYTDDATIPPFLLQPIIENAIKFGLYGTAGLVTISIHISLSADFLEITVTNPYNSTESPARGTGFGLTGIRRRLFLLYARADLLETQNTKNLFTTILKIPRHYVQSDINR